MKDQQQQSVIATGPFSGLQIPAEEVVVLTRGDGSTVMRDGNPVDFWPTPQRTPHFLSKFPPEEGWAIDVESTLGPVTFGDHANAQVSTVMSTAALKQYGQVVAKRSVLAILTSPGSWAGAETQAVGKLYDALGLPGYQRPMQEDDSLFVAKPQGSLGRVTIPVFGAPSPVADDDNPLGPPSKPQATHDTPATPVVEEGVTVTQAPTEGIAAPEVAQVSEPAPVVAATPAPAATAPAPSGPTINANLLQQIRTQAGIKGVEVPTFSTAAEAKSFLKQLYAMDARTLQ
jgi:hypothetical protein